MAEQLVNVHDLVGRCPFATSQKLLAGKWSLLIMHELSEGPVRFRELERRLYPITQATLTRALRQLEDDVKYTALFHQRLNIALPKWGPVLKQFSHPLKIGATNISTI